MTKLNFLFNNSVKNLIPHFIAEKYSSNEYQGSFTAATMFLDISGFTPMTERFMSEGKEGAEVLNRILNNIFGPVIEVIYNNGGFISTFAGDALIAIFPRRDNSAPMFAIDSAKKINEIFVEIGLQQTRFGNFRLDAKLGLSYGNVEWGIVGSNLHKTYFFRGEAVNACVHCEHHCDKMQIVLDQHILNVLNRDLISVENIEGNYYRLINIDFKVVQTDFSGTELSKDVLNVFLPEAVVNYNREGEFRNIVSVFISFKEPESYEKLNEFVSCVLDRVYEYGGYCEGINFGDKGANSLIIFGAPSFYEDIAKRACDFICAIKSHSGDNIRAGLASGVVFSGIKGSARRCIYGVLGDVVNLSARFMMKANWGSVWVSKAVCNLLIRDYEFVDLGSREFKGKSKLVPVFELTKKKQKHSAEIFQGEMVGRQKEYNILQSHFKPVTEGKFGGIVYVYGEAGIGKSRLVYEATESLKPNMDIISMQTDGMLRRSMSPFVDALSNYFQQHQCKTDEGKKEAFDKIYEEMISDLPKDDKRISELIKELKRTKSFIGAVLGLHWEGSLYEQLDPKGRYENTHYAITDFFKAQSLVRPVVLLLEDLHWIDQNSLECFTVLTRNITDYPIVIIATSRIRDDGTKPKLTLDREVPQAEISIEYLPDDAIAVFVETQTGGKPDDGLVRFIKSKSLGNPFYIEQFCLYLKENKLLEIHKGVYSLIKTEIEIPRGINAIIIARIDRLAMEIKETVQIASVLGREVNITILFELIRTFREALEKNMFKEIINNCMNEQIWSALSEIRYIFRHALLRDAIYDMQLRARLRTLHKFAAETIAKLQSDKKDKYGEIAYHFDKAEVFDRAEIYYEKAGDYLKANYNNEEAIKQYDRILELATDKVKIAEVIGKKAGILNLTGKWDDGIKLLNKGIASAEQIEKDIDKKSLLSEMKYLLGKIFSKKGRLDDAMKLITEAKTPAKEIGDIKLYSTALINLGNVYDYKGDYDNAMKCYMEVRDICIKMGDKYGNLKANAIGSMGIAYLHKSDYDNAMKCFEECRQIFSESGNRIGSLKILGNMGILYNEMEDYDNAMKCLEECKQIAEEIGDRHSYSKAVGNMGEVYCGNLDYNNAMKCYEEDKHIASKIGSRRGYSTAIGNIGYVHLIKGDYDNAMKCLEEAKQISSKIGYRFGYGRHIDNMGNIYSARGDYDSAVKHYEEARRIFSEIGNRYHYSISAANMGDVYYHKGDYDNAMKCLEEAKQICSEIGYRYGQLKALGRLGDVSYCKGDYDIAMKCYEKAINLSKELEYKSHLSEFMYKKANLLFDINQVDEAKIINDESFEIATEVDYQDIIFLSTLLKHKIENNAFAIESMLENIKDEKYKAIIHFELWKMTRNHKHRKIAIELYSKLYEKTPKYEFKKHIEEMT